MKLTYFDGRKAVGIGDLDRFLEYLMSEQTGGALNKDALYEAVAFVYRGVQLRAQTLSALPFEIVRGEDVVDQSSDYKNTVGWLPDPVRTLNLLEQSLCVAGYAYWFISRNRAVVLDLQYWNPYTVKPDITEDGLQGFKRSINGKPDVPFDIEDVFYVYPPDYRVEVGPPRGSPVTAAFKAAGVLDDIDDYVQQYFKHGAIKPMILAAKGMTKEADRKVLRDWFKKRMTGLKKAFNVEVTNADTLTAIPIGEGIEDMDNSALTNERRESVAVALGIPMSKLLSGTVAGLGGGGIAEQDDVNFYQDTIEPEGRYIAAVMNEQLFLPYGDYRIRFLWDTLDVYQVDEQKRALSFATYVQSDMKPEVAAVMLGLEIPQDDAIPEWYADAFIEPQPVPAALQGEDDDALGGGVVETALAAERKKEKDELEKSADLDKWRKKAVRRYEEGNPEKALDFDSESIEGDVQQQISYALKYAQNVDDVKAVFDNVGDVDYMTLLELKRANDLLEVSIATD